MLRNLTTRTLFLILCVHLTTICAKAQYFTGPISTGTGGAGRAGSEVSETMLLNPATIPHGKSFEPNTFYSEGFLGPEQGDLAMGLSAVDNTEGVAVPGGLSYIKRRRGFSGQSTVDEDYINFSIANFVAPHLSLGFSLIHLDQKQEVGKSYQQWDGVIGLHYNPLPDLGLAAVYYHFVDPAADLPSHLELGPSYSLGSVYIVNDFFRVKADINKQERLNPDGKLDYNFGFETFPNSFNILRLGWKSDQRLEADAFTMGYSFVGPRFIMDYSYFQSREEAADGALHSVDIRFLF